MIEGFYFDEHLPRSVAKGLIERGCKVVMAIDVEMVGKDDDTEHLRYATEHNLVMVTFDRPFTGRTVERTDHAGLICMSESIRNNIGGMIRLLLPFSQQKTSEDVAGQVFWLK
jgi:hypothetical protein